jgi:putative endonuclease
MDASEAQAHARRVPRKDPSPSDSRQNARGPSRRSILAADGERVAAEFLERRGLVIVERNFRCPAGEIDLVVLDGETLVFVEVKLRHPPFDPLEAVDDRKRRQVTRAAFDFLLRRGMLGRAARFDVIAVEAGTLACTHVPDAFDSEIDY